MGLTAHFRRRYSNSSEFVAIPAESNLLLELLSTNASRGAESGRSGVEFRMLKK